jgi:hypothetical protein
MASPLPTPEKRRPASSQIVRLVERIRALVTERRALERGGSHERLEAKRHEIERLQWRLANLVRRELSETGPTGGPPTSRMATARRHG